MACEPNWKHLVWHMVRDCASTCEVVSKEDVWGHPPSEHLRIYAYPYGHVVETVASSGLSSMVICVWRVQRASQQRQFSNPWGISKPCVPAESFQPKTTLGPFLCYQSTLLMIQDPFLRSRCIPYSTLMRVHAIEQRYQFKYGFHWTANAAYTNHIFCLPAMSLLAAHRNYRRRWHSQHQETLED